MHTFARSAASEPLASALATGLSADIFTALEVHLWARWFGVIDDARSVGVRLLFTSASARWRQRLLPRAATALTKSLGIEFVFVIVPSSILARPSFPEYNLQYY
jgi:hypothetical protein